jgi:hypothetical protein
VQGRKVFFGFHNLRLNRYLKSSNLLQEMTEDFQELRRIVLQNWALQKDLQKISDREDFVIKVVEIGREKGLNVESEDVLEAMREGRRVWVERWI